MMKQNDMEILQNRFTAYVATAIRRRRKDYIQKLGDRQAAESYSEPQLSRLTYDQEEEIFAELPLPMQLEDDTLLCALKTLTEQERHIFLSRALDGRDFKELAAEYGMQYKGITTAYYRTVRKIEKYMKGCGR